MYISGYFCDELCAVVGEPSTPVLSRLILMNVISNSDSSCRLIQHEYRVMFLMWACEVIIVCDKIWVVDCVASLTRYRYMGHSYVHTGFHFTCIYY